jgi:hypothetical protein
MNELTKLANAAHTDKGTEFGESHGFTEFYEPYFREMRSRGEKLKILEIGVQTGSSLEMLQNYFPLADIYGLDISMDLCNRTFSDRVHLFKGDQNSKENLEELAGIAGGKFDIVIDDGSHMFEHQFHSLLYLMDYVAKDGFYIMEDLHTSLTWGDCDNSPLHFLNFHKMPSFYTEEEYQKVKNGIDSVVIFSRQNEKGLCDKRSITSIIKFK